MADNKTAGFLDALGLGQTSVAPRFNPQIRGGGPAASAANIVRSAGRGPATQALVGLAGGIEGLITGEGGRGFREFGRDFSREITNLRDAQLAEDQGITVQKLRRRRALKKELDSISVGGGSIPEQINAATQVAQKASAAGDIEIAMNAAQLRAQLKAQLQQQRQAGIENDQQEIALEQEEAAAEIGGRGTLVSDPDNEGKFVRIDTERAEALGLPESSVGKFVFVGSDGERQIVDGVDIVPRAQNGLLGKQLLNEGREISSWQKLLNMNGATSGNIPKMRGQLEDMSKQGTIVTDITRTLLQLTDPSFAFDLTGKATIQGHRIASFVGNASDIIFNADNGAGASERLPGLTWNGRRVTEQQLRQEFVSQGQDEGFLLNTLNRLAGDQGLPQRNSLNGFLPQSILDKFAARGASVEQIARISEQYWANVMELAYMDARLQEPSNRGLSDKDITNALRRIGAATANPASFAQRQMTLLRRVQDSITSLGSMVQVPHSTTIGGRSVEKQDVIDLIWPPGSRRNALESVVEAQEGLGALLTVDPKNTNASPPVVDELLRKVQAGQTITDAELNSLSNEELTMLKQAIREGNQ